MNFDWGHWKDRTVERGLEVRASLLNSTAMRRAAGFRRDEDGASGMLSFYVTLMILLMAGLGVDTMRHEMERTHIQATLDAAVLAGAGAPQGTTATEIKDIVEDYFDKKGLAAYLHDIETEGDDADIQTSLNATKVYAEASMDVDTYLLQMTGVDTLGANGAAQAEVATPKLEVSVVLDVSTSMQGTALTNLKTAAKSFVTTILNQAEPGDAVISVIPFSWNVTPGQAIMDALTVDTTHDYSTCLHFDAADYDEASIDPDTSYTQQIFTSRYYNDFDDLNFEWRSCYADENAEILPYSISESDLHTYIDALTALGNTSASIGMKWGAAMLDDDFQDVVEHLQQESVGIVDASLDNLPSTYGEAETLKVIVLMADGVNTYSLYFNENGSYVGPDSDLYKFDFQDDVFEYGYVEGNFNNRYYQSWAESYCVYSWFICEYESIEWSTYYLRDGNDFYDMEADVWRSYNYVAGHLSEDEYESHGRLDWEVAWGLMSPRQYAHITGDWGPYNEYVDYYNEDGATKDVRMQNICTATKNEGVVVYTIGYNIEEGGNAETQLQDCATTFNHYYPTNGTGISSAFNSIASNVKNLRLTQ